MFSDCGYCVICLYGLWLVLMLALKLAILLPMFSLPKTQRSVMEFMEIQGVLPDNIRNKILLPFVDETIATLHTMADLEGKSDLLSYRDPLDVFVFKDFAVCIAAKTAGRFSGKIIMNYDVETAVVIGNRVRAKMLGTVEESTVLNNDVREALAEFSNTVIGLATRHFNGTEYKTTFGTPLYLLNKEDGEFLLEGIKQILTVPIDIAGVGRFYFSYLLN